MEHGLDYDFQEFQEALEQMRQGVQFARQPVRVVESNENTICLEGRLAPSLFLIGVQKSASTTLATRIASSPDIIFGTTMGGNSPGTKNMPQGDLVGKKKTRSSTTLTQRRILSVRVAWKATGSS